MAYSIEQRDEQLLNTTSAITYDLAFERASQHLMMVRITVANVTSPTVTLVMPSWTPGSYKIRDYAGWQGNVEVFTGSGAARKAVPFAWRDKASIVVQTQGADTVVVEYVIYGNERSVRTNHVNRNHAFVVPAATFMYVEGREQEVHHVRVHHGIAGWTQLSTQLSPVHSADGVATLGALNYDILVDSPMEIGNHAVRTFEALGARHEVAIASNVALDIDWLTEQVRCIVETEGAVFEGVPYDRYVFIIQAYPGNGGGLEHARSSVNGADPAALLDTTKAVGLLSLLCHEYFHLWNIKRIRPIGLGPFDYTRETYTPMLWLAEGLTSYYDDLFTFRCGFITEKGFLDGLAVEQLGKLERVPGRTRMSVRDSSYLAWVKLYLQSPDGNNRFPSYYLKGGLIFLLLDLYVIDHSDGRKTLDDGLRGLWDAYRKTPERGLTEDEVIAVLERATGVQLRNRLMQWLDTTQELPVGEMLEKVGLKFEAITAAPTMPKFGVEKVFATVPAPMWAGWSLADVSGRMVVRSVEDGSPAQVAGVGVDDEIMAIDGRRVTSVALADQMLQLAGGKAVAVTAQCDGILYSVPMLPKPQTTYKLVDLEKTTDRQKELRSVWLKKP